MKNIFKSLMLVAVAAMAFTSCEKGNEGADSTPEAKVTVKFSADFAETRTSFGDKTGAGYPSTWSGNEIVSFSLNEANCVNATISNVDGTRANFDVELANDSTTEGAIYAFSPTGTYSGDVSTAGFTGVRASYDNAYVWIPTEQTPQANSCDESAHLIAATLEYTDGIPSSGHLTFAPVAAFGKMTIEGFEGTIKSVTLTASEYISANAYYYYAGEKKGTMTPRTSGSLYQITLNATNVVDNVFWFGCIPADLTDGSLEVVITDSENNILTKTINPTTAKPLIFKEGRVSTFSVDFTDITPEEPIEIEWVNNAYNLIPDTANLKVGDKVVIAAAGYNKAIGAKQNNNFKATDITKKDNGTIDFDNSVTILTVVEGSTAGTFAFMTGSEYLYAASSSSNNLKTQNTNDVNSSFTVTIADGVATVKAEKSSNRNWMRYNNSSDLFSCYKSGQADISIYRLVGEYAPAVPPIEYSVNDVTINYDATSGEATVTVTNAEGWNITAETEAIWVSNLAYADEKITFTTDVNNTAEARTATVNVTATKEGYDNVTTTFNIKQNTQPTGGGELGDPWSYEWTANENKITKNGTSTINGLVWSLTTTASNYQWDSNNNRGWQVGTVAGDVILKTSSYEGAVNKIELILSTNGSGNTASVSVGGTAFGAAQTIASGTSNANKTYTFTSETPCSGEIVITLNDKEKSVYFKGISINPAN